MCPTGQCITVKKDGLSVGKSSAFVVLSVGIEICRPSLLVFRGAQRGSLQLSPVLPRACCLRLHHPIYHGVRTVADFFNDSANICAIEQ